MVCAKYAKRYLNKKQVNQLPPKIQKECSHPGCHKLTIERYCPECQEKYGKQEQKDYDRRRGNAAFRGYNSQWQKYSKRFLAQENNQFCKICGRLAECVDHIIPPKSRNDPLFWDKTNHQSLCISCNSKKGRKILK